MKQAPWLSALLLLLGTLPAAHAQVPPTPSPDEHAMLSSPDPKLERNKKFVYDFWRIVFEAGHMDQAPKYMAETYIQHNPNVASGRAAFIALFTKARPPRPIEEKSRAPIISIVAERDIVMISTVRKVRDRANPEHIYYMTWFDVFRLDDKGLIAEHWDPSEMWVNGAPPGAEFFK